MLLYETTASCSSALSASPHQTSAQLDVSLYLLLLLSFGVYSSCFQEPQEAEDSEARSPQERKEEAGAPTKEAKSPEVLAARQQ